MGMEELTNSGMKDSLVLQSLPNRHFNNFWDENDQSIYTYTDPFMRNFVRNSIKSGRCNAFNQRYESEISDDALDSILRKSNVNGNICNFPEKYFEFLNKYEKLYAKEIDSKYEDSRDINREEKTDYIYNKPNMLPIHEELTN